MSIDLHSPGPGLVEQNEDKLLNGFEQQNKDKKLPLFCWSNPFKSEKEGLIKLNRPDGLIKD